MNLEVEDLNIDLVNMAYVTLLRGKVDFSIDKKASHMLDTCESRLVSRFQKNSFNIDSQQKADEMTEWGLDLIKKYKK